MQLLLQLGPDPGTILFFVGSIVFAIIFGALYVFTRLQSNKSQRQELSRLKRELEEITI